MVTRNKPCLCISCPKCGAIFLATALHAEFQDEKSNNKLVADLTNYASDGYDVGVKENGTFKLKYCSHIKYES